MADERPARGVLDTSVVIDAQRLEPTRLPADPAVSAVTFAELAVGTHVARDADERARRQERLQRLEATLEPLPVDAAVTRSYGRIVAAVVASGRKARGPRALDLLIAATALAAGLPLYTRNPSDFEGLGDLVEIVAV
ncbi:MAG TPA: PIN domain-containing protein [Gaiellaceae bacterium]|nr:PIN domain-containing protein [Gaiellaceae bacterium]